MEAVWIGLAFVFGLLFRQLGLPPLTGYLAAGFLLSAYGRYSGQTLGSEALEHLAHIGVLLLLFTVGLKLRLKNVLRAEVWGGGVLHLLITSLLFAPGFYFLLGLDWQAAVLLAVALAFSSTVVAAKVLESKRELRAFHGRVAIGILIIQDLLALAVLSIFSDHSPSPYALLLLALPLIRPLLYRLLEFSGHDELLLLFGLLLAVVGGAAFEAVGLSSELGALVLGALLADHARASEFSHTLWGIKEIFLVGFFLMIGMAGLPDAGGIMIAVVLVLLLPLKAILFFYLLVRFKLRARSSFLAALSLASYSEFGLIVANVALPDWIAVLALAVALSFVVAAPLNRIAHQLYERLEAKLLAAELDQRHPDEQPVSLGLAQILIMGMGQTGTAAYDFLSGRNERLVGLDSDPAKVQKHLQAGRRVLYADAEDPGFWHGLKLDNLKAIMLCMNDVEAKIIAARQLRNAGFSGVIVANSFYDDEAEAITAAGSDMTFLALSEAGVGLAEHVWEALYEPEEAAR